VVPCAKDIYDTIYSKLPVYRVLPIYSVRGCGAAWSGDESLKAI